jgi:hypothetical protein
MSRKLFISQAAVDTWVSSEKAELQGDVLTLGGGAGAFRLRPASLFRKVAGDGEDRHQLVGKVKDEEAIAALGAEAYMTSVLFDDIAYDVEPGFLAIPVGDVSGGGRALLDALRAATS